MYRCFCEKELLPEIRGSVQESTQELGQLQTSFNYVLMAEDMKGPEHH